MIALFVIMALEGSIPPAIREDGWTYQAKSPDQHTHMFIRPFTGRTPLVRGWVRYENTTPGVEVKSSRLLMEFDCDQNRSKTVQVVHFRDQNLEGESWAGSFRDWEFAGPMTFAEAALNHFCDPENMSDEALLAIIDRKG